MPIYAHFQLFAELKRKGMNEVLLGGSEHRELNQVKRELGAKHIPSYWIVKFRE